ncbi:ribonuclease BN [Kluyvera intermedia]|uniref:ribonuclease BN n=1 Tax=Kluyvera intermedia TaxID=61648 RepID=UPI0034A5441A
MQLTFLGTSAGVPTRTRNVTAMLLQLQHPTQPGLWLFDCGEGTQHQLLRTAFHPGKIERIFISHLHGDHLFGLPGLICSRSMAGNIQPLTIYGPQGLKEYVETSLRLSGSWTDFPLEIVEIRAGNILDDGLRQVTAYPLDHPVECYGFRVEEHDKPGALDAKRLIEAGVPFGPLFQRLKAGESITLADGRTVNGADFLAPATPGKKIAIFGDTAPCESALEMARDVDLMVHEATLEAAMAEKANSRGHSSSEQTAQLAQSANVKQLIITHVSSRYDAEDCRRLLAECRSVFPTCELAEDFSTFTLP